MLKKVSGLVLTGALAASAQVSVLTSYYDNARTGLNVKESALTVGKVGSGRFGKVWSYQVDGSVYAQPLYYPNVSVPGVGTRNVLYVATMNDTVYAFDADRNTVLWKLNVTNAAAGIYVPQMSDILPGGGLGNVVGPVGIQGTPAIDPSSQTLYFVARTKYVSGSTTFYQSLHAVDLATGAEKFGGPVNISASAPGNGDGGTTVTFNPKMNMQRPGLALARGQVIISWGSHEDYLPYHGWVMTYDMRSLAQTTAFCTTPNGSAGAIWHSGRAPAIDGNGNIYITVSNGTTDQNANWSENVLKLSSRNGFYVQDYFTASDYANLNAVDNDLGSSGVMIIPGAQRLFVGAKNGQFFILNSNQLGHYAPGDVQIPQTFFPPSGSSVFTGPVYWESQSLGRLVYIWTQNAPLRAYRFNGNNLDLTPAMTSTVTTPTGGNPGAAMAISSTGGVDGSGIVWASTTKDGSAWTGVVPGVLHALNASDITQELWNSEQNSSRDSSGFLAKFVPPTVANGRVYMASFSDGTSSNYVNVYGLLRQAGEFSLSISPSSQSVVPGATATYTVSVGSLPGSTYTGTVSLTIGGLPEGASATFSPAQVTGAGTSTLTITTTPSAAIKTTTFAIAGTDTQSGQKANASATLNVVAGAKSISLNFQNGTDGLGPTEVAGVVPEAHWNGLAGYVQSAPVPLVDETGATTEATVTWSGDNTFYLVPVTPSTSDQKMMFGYLDNMYQNDTSVVVNGLPISPGGYKVYVYSDGYNADDRRTATFTLTGTGTTTQTQDVTDVPLTDFTGTYTQATPQNSVGNYAIFTVSGSTFTLKGHGSGSDLNVYRAPINGLQIIPQ